MSVANKRLFCLKVDLPGWPTEHSEGGNPFIPAHALTLITAFPISCISYKQQPTNLRELQLKHKRNPEQVPGHPLHMNAIPTNNN